MDITYGDYTVSGSANTTRISSHRISARVEMQQPLRGASLIPVPRGGRAITLTIEVLHQSASYSEAEALRTTLGSDVEAMVAHADAPVSLSISGRAIYSEAALEDLEVRDMGVSTLAIWRFVASGKITAP